MAGESSEMALVGDVESAWSVLVTRMKASLSEQDAERLERCCEVARKKLRRQGLEEPPIDKGKVKAFLLEYSKLGHRYSLCVKRSGVDAGMLLTAWDLWPEGKFVCDYVRHMRHAAREMANEDRLDDALAGLDRLNTEEGCKLNAKAVMFTLAGLDREHFGEDRGVDERRGKGQVTYVIPNLTVNNIYSPAELEARKVKALEASPAIDVEAVVSEPVVEAVE